MYKRQGMDCANKSVAAADLVIFIGTQTSDQTTVNWNVPKPSVKAIQIDIDCSELGRSYPDCIGLWGDARTVTDQLAMAISKTARPDWRAQVASYCKDTFDNQTLMWEDTSCLLYTSKRFSCLAL